jgi:hypothetical protein
VQHERMMIKNILKITTVLIHLLILTSRILKKCLISKMTDEEMTRGQLDRIIRVVDQKGPIVLAKGEEGVHR